MGATQVVNGIVCVYEAKRVMVCNVYTGEITWLPSISCDDSDFDSYSNSKSNYNSSYTTVSGYYFGYDPVNGVYKLLGISSSVFSFRGDLSVRKRAHIITLSPSSTASTSSSSWRKLHTAHIEPLTFPQESFLFNGLLYWVVDGGLGNQQRGLICLDLNTEEFHFIKPPQEPIFSGDYCSRWRIARFMERLAVLVPGKEDPPESLVIYTLDNNNYEDGSSVSSSWTRHTIPFPPGFGGSDRFDILPVGNLPTGQILLNKICLSRNSNSHCKPHYTPVYSYDHRTNKFEKFVAGDLSFNPFVTFHYFPCSISYTLEENSVPLDVLFRSARVER
ncbi:hypothetical protein ACH5RR_019101 [Cinchona calisaya]|uniref:F-box associated beta-propeller type 3 domain-containing protein n=1 Tax=Cinchona calisaya TaxID=153742 RepID=A0ABD2ZS01_9GENT